MLGNSSIAGPVNVVSLGAGSITQFTHAFSNNVVNQVDIKFDVSRNALLQTTHLQSTAINWQRIAGDALNFTSFSF
jgi:hypothetical protein